MIHDLRFKKNSGITLLEILVVLSIMGVLSVGMSPKILNFYNRFQLDAGFQDIIQVIRIAEIKAMQSEGGSPYSVHLVTGLGGSFTLFRGTDYVNRDINYDEYHKLPSAINLTFGSGTSTDMIFSKYEATTTSTGTLSLDWPDGNLTKSFSINSYGVITRN